MDQIEPMLPAALGALLGAEEPPCGPLLLALLDALPVGVFVVDARRPDRPIVAANRALCELTGYPPEEILGRDSPVLQEAGSDPKIVREIRTAWDEGLSYRGEILDERKDGTPFCSELTLRPLGGPEGQMTHLLGTRVDVTARRKAEEALRESEQRFRTVLEGSPDFRDGQIREALHVSADITAQKRTEAALRAAESRLSLALDAGRIGTWEWNLTTEVLTWDSRQMELFGLPPGAFDGSPDTFLALVHPDDRERLLAEKVRQSECLGRISQEFRIIRPDGSIRWLVGDGLTVCGDDDRPGLIYGINYDVTDRKRNQLELEEARDRAEAANRAKSTFLATMSHEIRTPMNGVLGMADLLLYTGLTEEQQGLVETLRSSGQALLRVLNQILDLSKIESGRMELAEARFSPRRLMADAADLIRPAALEHGLDLEVTIDWPDHLQAVADELRLRQIVLNFLDNAIKHTDQGSVRAALSGRPVEEGRWLLRLAVTDTGKGVAPEDRDRLFQPFQQLESSRFRGGTGLGLAICRRLAELMGGRVGYHGEPGTGATFWAEVPVGTVLAPPQEATWQAAIRRPWRGKRVLLAEDDAINQRVAQAMLELLGVAVDIRHNGREVVDSWQDGIWDAVLMDCQMPELDGWQATGWIRTHERRVASRTPIVAFTAYAMETDRERCFQVGMDDILVKPITLQALSTLLDRLWAA
jgi:PAS domain S-box-containing protein